MGRLVTERSKEVASIASGAGLPSASGCKDPLLPLVLSLSFAPERCSGAFSMRTLIADSRSGLIPLTRGTPVNQSPIPLIYLGDPHGHPGTRWDSVTYPLDILEVDRFYPKLQRFLMKTRQKIMSCSGAWPSSLRSARTKCRPLAHCRSVSPRTFTFPPLGK